MGGEDQEQNAKLYEEYPQARPPATEPAAGSAQTPLPGPAASPAEGQGASPRRPRAASSSGGSICRVDRDAPDVSVIEEAADVLLGGGVVALPTDTVYGLAADATNQHAVQELYQIKDRDPKKAVPVLVDSIKLFRALVHDLPAEVEALIEKLWPGALTVVARKKRGVLQSVSLGETIGVRMPNSMVALAVISMLARPMATSSANVSGRSPATSAQEVMRTLGNKVDLILDAGPTPGGATSTVLSVVERPFTILRQGQIERAALHEILGDLLA
jgi:L-threonylcarbamoyladenylate synthase